MAIPGTNGMLPLLHCQVGAEMRIRSLLTTVGGAVALLAGCTGGEPSHPEGSPSVQAGDVGPTLPRSCVVSPMGTGTDFGADSGAVHFSWPPVLSWNGPGISPVALRVEAGTSQVLIAARLLGGTASAAFTGFGEEKSPVSELVLAGPFTDAENLLGYIILPEPGCWRFEIYADGEKQSVTIYTYGETPRADCPISQSMEVRPDIAPGLGAGPVWMIAAPAGECGRPDELAKTIWIVDDLVQGQVRITGRRLDGDELAGFQGYDGAVSADGKEILLDAPHSRSTDKRGYVIYPAPGCWEFTVEFGAESIPMVVYMYSGWPGE